MVWRETFEICRLCVGLRILFIECRHGFQCSRLLHRKFIILEVQLFVYYFGTYQMLNVSVLAH